MYLHVRPGGPAIEAYVWPYYCYFSFPVMIMTGGSRWSTDVLGAGGFSSSGRTLKKLVRSVQREMWAGRLTSDWQ